MNVRLFGKLTLTTTFALLGVSLAGCKRSVCEPVPLDEFWSANKQWIPPGATICSTKPMGGAHQLEMDFADDPNPFVTITNTLEAQGFRRTSQSIQDPDVQSMMLERGKPGAGFIVMGVNLSRMDGRWNASMHTDGEK